MIRYPFLVCGLLFVLCTGPSGTAHQGENDRLKRFEQQIEELRTTLRIPGLSGAILRDQKVIWAKGFGHADVEANVAATPETNYRIASLTKPIASTLLLQLVEQRKLDLDEPMAARAPAFHERFRNEAIRVRHVFTHTSHDPPGASYRYDGNRFSYLSAVLEHASGRSFRQQLVTNILDKIGMTGSVPGQDILADRGKWTAFLDPAHVKRYEDGLARLAKPYRLYGSDIVRAIYPPQGISAAAGLVSNAIDLARYDVAVDRHVLVTSETQERAWTPAVSSSTGGTLPYGLGWFIQRHQELRLVWHYGFWPDSFSSLYLKVPGKNLSLVLLANSDGLSAPFRLGNGDATRSAFASAFLRLFVFEDALGRRLPDPSWSQSREPFAAELGRLKKAAGGYLYESEARSHDFMTGWLEERRASVRKVIAVDPKTFDDYVGRYEVEPGESLTVTRVGARLFARLGSFEQVELFPEAEHRFFAKAQEISITFEKDDRARVSGVEIRFWGQRIRAKRSQ